MNRPVLSSFFVVGVCLLLWSVSASAQTPSPVLQGSSLSVIGEIGGPAGGYTLGVEHLVVQSAGVHVGMYLGGSYAQNWIWDGTSMAVTAGAVLADRIGAIGAQPLALEWGLGATRVHSEFQNAVPGPVLSSTSYLPYVSGALRTESASGRFGYRLGFVFFADEGEPFLLPVLGVRVGL